MSNDLWFKIIGIVITVSIPVAIAVTRRFKQPKLLIELSGKNGFETRKPTGQAFEFVCLTINNKGRTEARDCSAYLRYQRSSSWSEDILIGWPDGFTNSRTFSVPARVGRVLLFPLYIDGIQKRIIIRTSADNPRNDILLEPGEHLYEVRCVPKQGKEGKIQIRHVYDGIHYPGTVDLQF